MGHFNDDELDRMGSRTTDDDWNDRREWEPAQRPATYPTAPAGRLLTPAELGQPRAAGLRLLGRVAADEAGTLHVTRVWRQAWGDQAVYTLYRTATGGYLTAVRAADDDDAVRQLNDWLANRRRDWLAQQDRARAGARAAGLIDG